MRAYAKDSVPDWVRDAAKTPLPEYKHNPNAVILLDDQEYTIQPNGHAVLHERIVRKILRPQGRDKAEFYAHYNKDSKVNWMHIWSIGTDGHEYALKDKEQVDVASVSYILYEDDRYRAGKAPAGDPGAIVAMEYEEQEPYYMPEILWGLNDNLPIVHNRLTVKFPAGFTYSVHWKKHDPITAVNLGGNNWQWEQTNIPAIDMRDVVLPPEQGELISLMTLHYAMPGAAIAEDWKAYGEWYVGLTQGRTAVTPEMKAKALELTAGKTDFYERAKAIQNFVRGDIRYVAVEVGVGGYQPHAAADIFSHRYGDCKDKATLLAAMLSAVGIHSTWLWVDVEHTMDQSMPSLLGDHMVAAIEVPPGYESPEMHSLITLKNGKRFLITDPTWEKTPFGQIEHELQGTSALLVDGEQSQSIVIPVMDPDRNTWTRTAHMKLAPDGSLEGDVVESMYGDEGAEFRYAFEFSDEHRRTEILDHHVNADITGFILTNVKVDDLPEVDKPAVLSYTVHAKSYAKAMGPMIMVRPRLLGSDVISFDDRKRIYVVNMGETVRKQDSFDVELPAGYVVDELPVPVKKDVGFASYESTTTVQGNVLHYDRTYTVRSIEIPAKQYDQVRELMSAILNDERSSAILRKTN